MHLYDDFLAVIPAKAGIQRLAPLFVWIPAFAGMTVDDRGKLQPSPPLTPHRPPGKLERSFIRPFKREGVINGIALV